jgi:hypothetical protein
MGRLNALLLMLFVLSVRFFAFFEYIIAQKGHSKSCGLITFTYYNVF